MLPPGPHFVGYSAVSKRGEVSPVIWSFVHLKSGEVLVRRWDHATELLLPVADEDEVCRPVTDRTFLKACPSSPDSTLIDAVFLSGREVRERSSTF